jgi:methylaspartate ammonia-lyase
MNELILINFIRELEQFQNKLSLEISNNSDDKKAKLKKLTKITSILTTIIDYKDMVEKETTTEKDKKPKTKK